MLISLTKSFSLLCLASAFVVGCGRQEITEVAHFKIGGDGPLVVILGGSEGGYPHIPFLIEELRSKSFTVAEVAYFGFPNGPKYLQEISIENVADEILAVSQNHDCVGVLGISKGAELSLLLAAYQPVANATVAMVPSNVVWQSSRISLRSTSSWTIDGHPLQFVGYDNFSVSAVLAALDYNSALSLHVSAIEDEEAVSDAMIPVESIERPVLLQSALHDQIWPSHLMSRRIMNQLAQLNPDHHFTHNSYDHDHYLLNNNEAVRDMLDYFSAELVGC